MKKARNIFWVVFVLSALALCALLSKYTLGTSSGLPDQGVSDSGLILWVPLITAITSLVGAVITSVATWRQGKLESKKTELELAKLQLEIKDKEMDLAKKQRELEALQKKDQQDGDL